MGPFGIIWDHWDYWGLLGIIWDHLVPFGSIWVHLGSFGKICVKLAIYLILYEYNILQTILLIKDFDKVCMISGQSILRCFKLLIYFVLIIEAYSKFLSKFLKLLSILQLEAFQINKSQNFLKISLLFCTFVRSVHAMLRVLLLLLLLLRLFQDFHHCFENQSTPTG